jgi:membrane protease YdiL (CAAX protease family)
MLVLATGFILICIPLFVMSFELFKNLLPISLVADTSSQTTKFGELKDNWSQFFLIIPFILIQSTLEELLDRAFLINWIEKIFPSSIFVTIFAVLTQALIFGFRHSNDISERSITVALIGLAMGLGYALFGRNLWPLIIVHCILNISSMLDRVA